MMELRLALFFVVCVGTCTATLKLEMIGAAIADEYNPMCLDGSPYGFYFEPATNASHANDWVIYFRGGGWCFSLEECYTRSQEDLGSSKGFTENYQKTQAGVIGNKKNSNPDFYDWNHVLLPYCDGGSFTGTVDGPVKVLDPNGTAQLLYFRGRYNLMAAMRQLFADHSFADAQNVVVYGTSAGGMSLMAAIDDMKQQMIPLRANVRSVVDSSFFPDSPNARGVPVYETKMRNVYAMQQSKVDHECSLVMGGRGEGWKCIVGQYAFSFVNTSMFFMSSSHDLYNTQCIFFGELTPDGSFDSERCSAVPGFEACSSKPFKCSDEQLQVVNGFAAQWQSDLMSSPTFVKQGNGQFIHSCYEHSASLKYGYNGIVVGGRTMQQALGDWWHSFHFDRTSEGDPAGDHQYLDCDWSDTQPYACNPTCQQ